MSKNMQPSTIYTVFFSPTGTSKKVASAIARGIARNTAGPVVATTQEDPLPADAVPIRTIDLTHAPSQTETLPPQTVTIFTVPVYGGHVPPVALERMQEVRGNGSPAVVVVVYGNRAFESAAAELAAFVSERGFVPVAAAAFVGEHSYSTPATPIAAGRPDAQDLAEAEAFGAAVRRKLAAGAAGSSGACNSIGTAGETCAEAEAGAGNPGAEGGKVRAGTETASGGTGRSAGTSGGFAPIDVGKLRTPRTPLLSMLRFIRFVLGYRRRQKKSPLVCLPAVDADRCTRCGRCAAVCPTQAIARGDELHSDPARCIRCCACVKGCPTGARTYFTPFAAALSRSFDRRKPPVTRL